MPTQAFYIEGMGGNFYDADEREVEPKQATEPGERIAINDLTPRYTAKTHIAEINVVDKPDGHKQITR